MRVIGGMDDYSPRQRTEECERISAAAIEVLALEQGPWEQADAWLELARQQKQKRPVAAVTPTHRQGTAAADLKQGAVQEGLSAGG